MAARYEFRKSSFSNAQEECVEVATNSPTTVAVRDSKDPDGPVLTYTRDEWNAFLTALRNNGSTA